MLDSPGSGWVSPAGVTWAEPVRMTSAVLVGRSVSAATDAPNHQSATRARRPSWKPALTPDKRSVATE